MLYLRNNILTKSSKNINYRKVRDHCHYTGKYRGMARSICNLKFSVPYEIPVIVHGGSNYDHQFIIKANVYIISVKYEYFSGEEILPSDQSRTIEQAKFTYSPLDKAFEKQKKKQLNNKEKKQIDAITNQNKRPEDFTNKDDYKSIYK